MGTLFLLAGYAVIILLDVLRHVRFVITRDAAPDFIISTIVRAAAGLLVTIWVTGFSWLLLLALPLYAALYWVIFTDLFEFAMPSLYRLLVHPQYAEDECRFTIAFRQYFPGVKGALIRFGLVIGSLVMFLASC